MIRTLLDGNRRFVTEVFEKDRDYFTDLGHEQNPTVLQIVCSDARVPMNTMTQTRAGEVFAHRNVCNIVPTNDWNPSAVPEFSINCPHIPDIVVCGHEGWATAVAWLGLRDGLRRNPNYFRLAELERLRSAINSHSTAEAVRPVQTGCGRSGFEGGRLPPTLNRRSGFVPHRPQCSDSAHSDFMTCG